MSSPHHSRLVIRGGRVLSMDPTIGELDADILVEGGQIVAVRPSVDTRGAEIVDAAGCFVLPGFVDTHRHAWQSVVRFAGVGWDVMTYLECGHVVIAPGVTPDDAHLGDLISAWTAIDAGITTICDESHIQHSPAHTDAVIAALRESGIRARFGYGWSAGAKNSFGTSEPHPLDMERVRNKILFDDSQLVTMYAMLRGPSLASPETNIDDIARARALGLRSSFHLGQAAWPELREIDLLTEAGLLGSDMCFIHCGAATDDQFSRMAATGVSLSVSASIENQMAGVGRSATARAVRAGIRPSFSVDTEIAVGGDMFGVMRAAYISDQLRRMDDEIYSERYRQLTPSDLLEFATIAGARSCGLGDVVGSLTPGKRADIILIDRSAINLISGAGAAATIVTGAHSGNVRNVYVDGVARKRDGRLVDERLFEAQREPFLEANKRLTAGLTS